MTVATTRWAARREWLGRVPHAWRAAAFSLVHGRPIGFVLVFAAAAGGLCAVVGARDPRQVHGLFVFVVLVLSLAVSRGMVAADRVEGRWILLFQRGQPPLAHYARSFTLSLAMVGLLVLGIAGLMAMVGAAMGVSAVRHSVALAVGGAAWALVLVSAMFAISSLVRRFDVEIMLLLLAASVLQGVAVNVFGIEGLGRSVVKALLLPIDGTFMAWQTLSGERAGIPAGPLLHLLLYPSACILLALLRLRRLATADLPARSG